MDSETEKKVVVNEDFILKAQANTISVGNNKESYDAYFAMGGTVGKMTLHSTMNYKKFIEQRIKEREQEE